MLAPKDNFLSSEKQVQTLYKKGLYLEYFTVAYNVVEAAVSILFGNISNSIALIGFGLDSVV